MGMGRDRVRDFKGSRDRDFKGSRDRRDRDDKEKSHHDKDRKYRRYNDRKYRRGDSNKDGKGRSDDRYKDRRYRRNGYRSKTGKSRPYVDYCCWTGDYWDCDSRKDSNWYWVGSYYVCPPFSRDDQYENYYD